VGRSSSELRVPLAQELPFAKDLVFVPGFPAIRTIRYPGGVNTYKFDVQWSPIEDIRFPAARLTGRSVRPAQRTVRRADIGPDCVRQRPVAAPANGVLAGLSEYRRGGPARGLRGAYGQRDHDRYHSTGRVRSACAVQGGNPASAAGEVPVVLVRLVFSPTAVATICRARRLWQVRVEGESTRTPPTCCDQLSADREPTYARKSFATSTDFSLQGATVAGGGYIVQKPTRTSQCAVQRY